MAVKILPAAKARLIEIWDYSERKWGSDQADKYVHGLVEALNVLQNKRRLWKPVREAGMDGLYFCRYRHHYLFFRELNRGTLGVISIIHESMDLPARLKEDAGPGQDG